MHFQLVLERGETGFEAGQFCRGQFGEFGIFAMGERARARHFVVDTAQFVNGFNQWIELGEFLRQLDETLLL